MNQHYLRQIDGCNLPDSIKVILRTREPTEDEYQEFVYMLQHADYYNVLDRIERGYEWIAQQTDERQISKGWVRISALEKELEEHAPCNAEAYQAARTA